MISISLMAIKMGFCSQNDVLYGVPFLYQHVKR